MEIHDLEGALLDAWVARAQGLCDIRLAADGSAAVCVARWVDAAEPRPYSPSTDWTLARFIIDHEHIALRDLWISGRPPAFEAMLRRHDVTWFARGELPLVAAMRVYVRSRFTEEEVRLRSFDA
ncbi:MAG: DUF2591 family protein [Proteobacteria bacterium]|nr:DUF2591 family protein [Pseudomonadota bacterium]